MRTLAVASLAWVAAVAACSAFGEDAPVTSTPDGGDDAEAPLDAGDPRVQAPPPPGSFCAGAPPGIFCVDFEEPDLAAGWISRPTPLRWTTREVEDAARGGVARVTIPVLDGSRGEALKRRFSMPRAATLAFDFRVDTSGTRSVQVVAVHTFNAGPKVPYAVYVVLEDDTVRIGEFRSDIGRYTSPNVLGKAVVGEWRRVTLRVLYGAAAGGKNRVSGSMAGETPIAERDFALAASDEIGGTFELSHIAHHASDRHEAPVGYSIDNITFALE